MAHKKSIALLGVIVVLGLFGILTYFRNNSQTKLYETTGLVVDGETLPLYIETHPVFKDLPKGTKVQILIGELAYQITGSEVTKGKLDAPDVTLTLPEGYESLIGKLGLCGAIHEAVSQNKISINQHVSTTQLFIKYRALLKYRNCIN